MLFDSLGQRPRGLLGMYMTYSGQLMLVACMAAARVLFRKDDRIWATLVMPALIAALAATLSRNAWVGACAGIGLLLLIRTSAGRAPARRRRGFIAVRQRS